MKNISPTYIILLIFFTSLQAHARIDSRMNTKKVKQVCSEWALESKTQGISTFIIGFEGLWSLSQRKVNQLQKYQKDLQEGKNPRLRLSGGGGYVTKGPMAYLVKNYGDQFAFTVLSHRSERTTNYSNGFACVKEWHNVFGDELTVHIIGHSFGGYASLFLMHKLDNAGIAISHMITADARAYSSGYKYFFMGKNVTSFENYFQRGFLRGYDVKGAHNERVYGESHGSIPASTQVMEAVDRIFSP